MYFKEEDTDESIGCDNIQVDNSSIEESKASIYEEPDYDYIIKNLNDWD